jgi:hypothetical protein
LQQELPEARNIPLDGQILGPFATLSKADLLVAARNGVRLSGKTKRLNKGGAKDNSGNSRLALLAASTEELRNSNAYACPPPR